MRRPQNTIRGWGLSVCVALRVAAPAPGGLQVQSPRIPHRGAAAAAFGLSMPSKNTCELAVRSACHCAQKFGEWSQRNKQRIFSALSDTRRHPVLLSARGVERHTRGGCCMPMTRPTRPAGGREDMMARPSDDSSTVKFESLRSRRTTPVPVLYRT